jgi:purine catabolism regulator
LTGVTIKEALTTHGFEESRVVAGEAGLGNKVKTVTVAEVPDAMDWLGGGELVITTAYYIKDDPQALKNWVQGLVDHGAVALAIKPERFIGTIPDAIKQIGNELAFPIIELPVRVTWPVIIEGVMNLILDRASALVKRSEEIHRRLTKLVLDSKGMDKIAGTVCDIVNNPVIIEDRWFNLLTTSDTGGGGVNVLEYRLSHGYIKKLKELQRENKIRMDSDSSYVEVPLLIDGKEYKQYIFFITAKQELYGYFSVIGKNGVVTDKDFIAMEHGSTVIALEFLKRRASFEAEGRLKADLLRTLLEEGDEEEIKYKAVAQGFDFSGFLTTAIVRVYKQEENPNDVQNIDAFLARMIHHMVKQLDPKVFYIPRQDGVILFLHADKEINEKLFKGIRDISVNIAKALEQNLFGYKPIIGVGNFYEGIKGIRQSYSEALEAVNTAKKFPSYGQVVFFDEMGCYRLLSMVRDRAVLEAYCQDTIGKLVKFDRENQMNLLETLENFLISNGNQADVARKMFLHVNTVAYRLNKIKELLGADLSQAETRFNLYLALKILENTK